MEFPVGTIIAWGNNPIPDGWIVCDGSYGTPSIIDRFVRGANSDSDLGSTGGSTTHSHTTPNTGTRGAHSHGGSQNFGAGGAPSVTGTDGAPDLGAPVSHGHNTLTVSKSSEDSHSHTTPNTNSAYHTPKHIKRAFIKRVE